ncbi:hypothetical protein [uncultured Oscillibacter sp.]|nr:hypothetical protein [uncultured Oscillibacter sp.]
MKNQKISASHVFVPGGFPKITYVAREEYGLENRVCMAKDNLTKLMVITGPTKSGKTVLVDKIFPQESAIWIDGGMITDENSFWELIVDKLDLFTSFERTESDSNSSGIESNLSLDGNVLVAKGGVRVSGKSDTSLTSGYLNGRSVSAKTVAISALRTSLIPLVVDDFHYIEKPTQKSIVRALKAPIMHGLPAIFIAIPNRKYDAIEVEREMTGRIENIEMPIWEEDELAEIAVTGFKVLNVQVKKSLIDKLTHAAYGSPFLMQEFCKALCVNSEIQESSKEIQYISENIDVTDIFAEIAEHSGRSMFEKLKRGPRARTDRISRRLIDGTTTDIYGVVMNALKSLQPGVESMPYDTLRANIKNIMIDQPPQKHEVSRVLDKIAQISYTDTSSTKVIDWQKDNDIITITDPFFAFFLKWAR